MTRKPLAAGMLALALLGTGLPAAALPSGGLTLDLAYQLAAKSSEAIRIKELGLQKTRLAIGEAASRALPHVDVQASASYLVSPPQGYIIDAGALGTFTPTIPANPVTHAPAIPLGTLSIPPNQVIIGATLHNYFSLNASLSQPLFTWGKIKNAIDLATLLADGSASELIAQQRDIERQVHQAYFGALLAQDSEAVLQRLRNTADDMVADRQNAFDQGTINREAVLDAQSSLATIEEKLVEAHQSKETALESLGILTGLSGSDITLATDFRTDFPALDEQALQAKAFAASTDLAATRTQMSQAQKKLAIEKGGQILMPDVSLGLTFGVTGQEDMPYSSWDWKNDTWNVDLVISLGIKMSAFDGLASMKRIGEAQKDIEMVGTGLTQKEKLVRLGVRKSVDAAVKADATVREKQAAAAFAAERLKNARSSFENGEASQEELHGADLQEGSAELNLLLARFTREEALADIGRLTGERQ
jgi:outer membrane protein TolC